MGRRAEHPCRLPCLVLGLEEAVELLVRDLDAEVRERLAGSGLGTRSPRAFRAPRTAARTSPGSAARTSSAGARSVAPESLQACAERRVHELLVEPELHQRVTPVEEDGAEHRDNLAAWRGKSSGAPSRLAPRHDRRGFPARPRRRRSCSSSPSLALVPLAWLIGEATEHAAHHTGPGIGGFLNATFGNAPELIISLLAINKG